MTTRIQLSPSAILGWKMVGPSIGKTFKAKVKTLVIGFRHFCNLLIMKRIGLLKSVKAF